jgi:phosphatase NudJ
MAREPIPTWFFVLLVVRRGDRFLLVQESKPGEPWYLPAGRVEPGEDFMAAARRECVEEAGIPIEIEGVLRLEHTPLVGGGARVRVILVARPRDDSTPKTEADGESLGADWFTISDMRHIDLRGDEVLRYCEHVAGGGRIYPLEVLGDELARGGGRTRTTP